ncbi:MAG: SMC-Scp complex subunit ScpB [Hyphomicrobiales bacterium]
MEDLKNILESLLFVAEEALSIERLKKLVGEADPAEIRQALEALQSDYDSRRGGFYLAEVAGGFQFRTRPDYTMWIRRLIDPKPVRLSKAALETLAIIAYKQPVIRTDVEHIRGVDCGGVLRQLLERKLIRVLGRKEIAGRPLIYATTKKFLETFDLKDLKDLPTPKEIEEFGKPPLEERGNITIEPDEVTLPPEQAPETPSEEGLIERPETAEQSEANAPAADPEEGPANRLQDPGAEPEKKLDFDPGTT